jgi:hypothetical protein
MLTVTPLELTHQELTVLVDTCLIQYKTIPEIPTAEQIILNAIYEYIKTALELSQTQEN